MRFLLSRRLSNSAPYRIKNFKECKIRLLEKRKKWWLIVCKADPHGRTWLSRLRLTHCKRRPSVTYRCHAKLSGRRATIISVLVHVTRSRHYWTRSELQSLKWNEFDYCQQTFSKMSKIGYMSFSSPQSGSRAWSGRKSDWPWSFRTHFK